MIEGRDHCVPINNINNNPTPLPRVIKRVIKRKNKLRRQQLLERDPSVKKIMRTQINFLQADIQIRIKINNDKICQKKLVKVDKPGPDLWRAVASLKSRDAIIPPLKRADSVLTSSKTEQCNVLAKAFHENMCLTSGNQSNGSAEDFIADSIQKIDNFHIGGIDRPVRPSELYKIVRHLKIRKASGCDSIDNILISSYFPDKWKTAKVIAIKKPGKDPTNATNYRPISLLPNLAKMFEKVIYTRLTAVTENKLINEQFGFRRCHSTTQQLARVAEHAAHNLNLGNSTGMVLLDLEKAFDTVWHHGLLHKMVIGQRFPCR
ncbi:hypothetical protein O0L34_g7987 [Tuta absoluta]|nr:hypothetical protein O0L34_g7987 [Tuta absoluta]